MSPLFFRRKTIQARQTLGEQLAAARGRLNLDIEDAERLTRVRAKYLLALEAGRLSDLPEDVYTRGFIDRYAVLLGLDPTAALREYDGERRAAFRLGRLSAPEGEATFAHWQPLREPRFVFTPKFVWIVASLAFILGIAGYVWYQVSGFIAPPTLDVAQPAPDMAVAAPTITIEGRTDGHAVVTINAEPVAIAPDGSFAQEVHLAAGINTIEITARNRLNKETKKQLRVLATY